MRQIANARATRARFQNFLFATLTLMALSGSLVWRGVSAQPAQAQPQRVPFRFMESSILETHDALEAGTITSEQLVQMYLARIDAYDKKGPAINAMIRMNPNALAEARALDADRRANSKKQRGPLYGVPMLLKDNYDTFDMPTSAASLSLATSVAPDDAYLTRRLREAGAIFVGKTNMHEFADGITTISSLGGQTLNPYDLTRNPGGSSGGTGAGISANFATVGMGSDTCGSIRIPSSHNSLTGLRVTQNLTSRDGIIPLSLTQDVGGALARNVTDLAVVLDATTGFDPNDPVTQVGIGHTASSYLPFLQTGKIKGARFGLMTDVLVTTPADQEVANVILAAADELRGLGATVINVAIPDFANVSNVSVINFEFRENLDAYLAATPNAPYKTMQEIFNSGLFHPSLTNALIGALNPANSTTSPTYLARLQGRVTFKQALVKAMEDNQLDALIYPTIRQKPITVPNTAQPGSNCRVSAQSGLPAISVQVGFTPTSSGPPIPVGMEFLGREFTEGDLLGLAYSWEQATHHRRPPDGTVPEIDPHWSYKVTDGTATFVIDPAGQQIRFTAPGFETYAYIDPGMKSQHVTGNPKNGPKPIYSGEFQDSHWHISYNIPTDGSAASIFVDNLWTGGGIYNLFGAAAAQ
jgi:Asp-tRNA(Asn)/Glu-tRNA(Gln) amidotransferase A subunit family amidase